MTTGRPCSGSYASPAAFVDGLLPALWVGVAVLAAGTLVALLVPGATEAGEPAQAHSDAVPVAA